MGGADRRGEVLAAGADGAAEPGGEGHLHRLRGWAEGISGSHRSGVSAHRGTALHRAPGAGLAELRALEAAQAGGDGPAVDLPRSHSGRGRAASPGTGRQMESLSQREPGVAAELGAHHAIFSLSAGHPASDLHHQQRGVTEPIAAQDYQDPRRLPPPRSGAEVAVSRPSPGSEEVDDADSSLAGSLEPLHHSVAGTDAGPGKNYAMNAHPTSTEMGRGRGIAPFPGTPSPKNNLGRLHKSLDTPSFFKAEPLQQSQKLLTESPPTQLDGTFAIFSGVFVPKIHNIPY